MDYGLAFYLQHQIRANGRGIIRQAKGRPLLFYVVDGLVLEMHYDCCKWMFNTFEVLLNNGADPMETFNERTPWSYCVAHISNHLLESRIFELMLEHGADPTARYELSAHYGYPNETWPPQLTRKHYSTAFHIVLWFCRKWRGSYLSTVTFLVRNCNDFEATDSDGIGVQDWADSIDLEMGVFLRQEIAVKIGRKRRRIH